MRLRPVVLFLFLLLLGPATAAVRAADDDGLVTIPSTLPDDAVMTGAAPATSIAPPDDVLVGDTVTAAAAGGGLLPAQFPGGTSPFGPAGPTEDAVDVGGSPAPAADGLGGDPVSPSPATDGVVADPVSAPTVERGLASVAGSALGGATDEAAQPADNDRRSTATSQDSSQALRQVAVDDSPGSPVRLAVSAYRLPLAIRLVVVLVALLFLVAPSPVTHRSRAP